MTHRCRGRLKRSASCQSGAVVALVFGLALVPAHSMVPGNGVRGPAGGAGRGIAAMQAPPAFRTGVDLLMFDVQVVSGEGKPVPRLTAAQFEVKVAGRGRTIVMTEFLHADDGPITRGNKQPNVDAATRVACVFGFERMSNRAHAHYLVSVEPIAGDKTKVEHPRIKVLDRSLSIPRFAWRSHIPPAGAAR